MSVLVVDASVAAKWYLPEEHTPAALRLLAPEHDLLAPDLLYAEIASIVWKRVVQHRAGVTPLSGDEAGEIIASLRKLPLQITSARDLVSPALEIALATGRSVYDSLYLALALACGADLVTADRRFFEAVAGSPLGGRVVWVGDIQ